MVMKEVDSVQRYFTDKKQDNNFILNETDTHHITKVMRMNVLDHVEVVVDKVCYECEIVNIDKIITVKPLNILQTYIKEPKKILLLPLLKEQKMDYVLQKSTELGVDEIILIETERSIIKLDNKKLSKKIERWQTILKEASEQAKRLTIPKIQNCVKTIKNLELKGGIKMVCSTRIPKNNVKIFLQNNPDYDKIFIAVGPEGGLTLNEENLFLSKGFEPVSLGNKIMRVETAPLFCLSVVAYESMECELWISKY